MCRSTILTQGCCTLKFLLPGQETACSTQAELCARLVSKSCCVISVIVYWAHSLWCCDFGEIGFSDLLVGLAAVEDVSLCLNHLMVAPVLAEQDYLCSFLSYLLCFLVDSCHWLRFLLLELLLQTFNGQRQQKHHIICRETFDLWVYEGDTS